MGTDRPVLSKEARDDLELYIGKIFCQIERDSAESPSPTHVIPEVFSVMDEDGETVDYDKAATEIVNRVVQAIELPG